MLFATPQPSDDLRGKLAELDGLRRRLGAESDRPVRWMGRLRRLVRASSVQSSTSIEGFHVPSGEAIALVSGETSPEPDDADRQAVACYARAMDHVGILVRDSRFRWVDRVILDLHFAACYFEKDKSPGLVRRGPIAVTNATGAIAYAGPDADSLDKLFDELTEWLDHGDLDAHVVVRAAMAHLHLVSLHPFRDGNGRISRIVQSLVLGRQGLVSPEFASIEEYLGRNTGAYYTTLQEVQGGRYQPDRNATQWVEFCVEAHLQQARQRLRQIEEAATRWSMLEELAERRGWPDRFVIALEQSLVGGSDRAMYGEEADVSPATASNDFRRLLDAGLVETSGRGRNIRYYASSALREAATA